MNPRQQAPSPITPILVASAIGLLVLLTSLSFWFSPRLVETGDLAANALQAERAGEGHELLGPYSRYGFHHPGPISFYGQVLAEPLFFWLPTILARHLLGQLLTNLIVAGWILRLLRRAGLEPGLAAPGVVLLILPLVFLGGGNAIKLAGIWGPSIVVLPTVLFIVAMARFGDGDGEGFVAAAAGGTIAYHNHLLTIPVLAAGLLVVAIATVINNTGLDAPDRKRPGRYQILAGVAIWLAGLVPLVVEQVVHQPGNLCLLWRFMRDHQPVVHPWSEVLHELGQAWTDPLVVLGGAKRFDGNSAVISLCVLGLLLAVSLVQYRRTDHRWRLVLLAVWGAILISFVQARYTYGQLHTYLFYYLYGLVGVLYVVVAREIRARWPRRLDWRGQRLDIVLVSLLLVGLGFLFGFHSLKAPMERDRFAEILQSLDLAGTDSVQLELGPGEEDRRLWPQLPTYALRWRRMGARVTVDSQFVYMCGQEMRRKPADHPEAVLVFTQLVPADSSLRFVAVDDWGVVALPDSVASIADLLPLMKEKASQPDGR